MKRFAQFYINMRNKCNNSFWHGFWFWVVFMIRRMLVASLCYIFATFAFISVVSANTYVKDARAGDQLKTVSSHVTQHVVPHDFSHQHPAVQHRVGFIQHLSSLFRSKSKSKIRGMAETSGQATPSPTMLHKIQQARKISVADKASEVHMQHVANTPVYAKDVHTQYKNNPVNARPKLTTIEMLTMLAKQQHATLAMPPDANILHPRPGNASSTPAIKDAHTQQARLIRVHYQSAGVLQKVIVSSLLKGDKYAVVTLDKRTNSLLLLADSQHMHLLERFIQCVDQPQAQVKIVARILDVDQQALSDLGIDLLMHQNAPTVDSDGYAMSLPHATANSGSLQLPVLQLPSLSQIDIKVSALQQSGNVKLIATPQLLTLNRHTATIQSGEDVPYQQATSSGATSIAFRRASLSLQVTPTILPQHKVRVDLVLNHDQVGTAMANGAPVIRTRQLKTWVTILQGQTIVLGGIFRTTEINQKSAIAWLAHIPVLGLLFRHHIHSTDRQQLLIFMTPHIVGSVPTVCRVLPSQSAFSQNQLNKRQHGVTKHMDIAKEVPDAG